MSAKGGLILVSGLCRCGTSLLMQMLAAGGWPVFGSAEAKWPGFEHPANLGKTPVPVDAVGIMKWLDPQVFRPTMERVRGSIFLTRNVREQARSHLKWNAFFGLPTTGVRWQIIAESLKRDEPTARGILATLGPVHEVTFEDLIARPRAELGDVSRWLDEPLDVDAAITEARPRVTGAACLPFLLEERLVQEARCTP